MVYLSLCSFLSPPTKCSTTELYFSLVVPYIKTHNKERRLGTGEVTYIPSHLVLSGHIVKQGLLFLVLLRNKNLGVICSKYLNDIEAYRPRLESSSMTKHLWSICETQHAKESRVSALQL